MGSGANVPLAAIADADHFGGAASFSDANSDLIRRKVEITP